MFVKLLRCKNSFVASIPNKNPAYLGDGVKPDHFSSGSDQTKSHIGPSLGTS